MFNNSSLNMYYGNNNTDEIRVVEWLNNAALSNVSSEKQELLLKVQEIILNKSPNLLLRFLTDVLSFTTDRDTDSRKWVVGFIEEACKKNPKVFEVVMSNLHMLLCDESVQVQKRVIQAAAAIFRNMLIWLAKAPQITEAMEQAWNQFSSIKVEILNMIDSDNDGVRTHSVKFLEGVVLLQTYPDPNAPRKDNDFSLEDIPLTLKFARRRKLEEEANHIFTLLLKFHGSPHISSVNLMACMGALCTIAKARPDFMPRVIGALEALLSNLPPTLTSSQVSSVKKHLKLQMINLLKHPSSYESQDTLISVLTELGASNQEIQRAIPKLTEQQRKKYIKRSMEQQAQSLPVKRARIEQPEEEIGEEIQPPDQDKESALKVNEKFIFEHLNSEAVTEIVMATMHLLPNIMPPHFNTSYAPVVNAGTLQQTRKLSKLLAVQFTEAGVGPGAELAPSIVADRNTLKELRVEKVEPVSDDIVMKEIKQEVFDPEIDKKMKQQKDDDKTIRKAKLKNLRLDQVTKPLTLDVRDSLLENSVKRILNAELAALKSGASTLRNKIITTLASTFGPAVRETVLQFILDDLKSQIDIALAWLYEEYSYLQGFSRMSILRKEEKPDQNYNNLICSILTHLENEQFRDRDSLMTRIILEAPMLTEEAVDILKRICIQENRSTTIMALLYDLVFRRPTKSMTFVNVLLHHTSHESYIIREEALNYILKLYHHHEFKAVIEEQAIVYLDFLTQSQPPPILFGDDCGRPKIADNWSDETCKACLYLYLALLPIKETLIHELSRIYTQTTADTKRIILRLLEQPVRGMGMDSPELLTLVESCPKGAETLVTRVIHILTDRGPPSAILVSKVRELYQTRVSDVRFLIPVLNGLTKKEIIGALPKLIKLNPIVVKEVFNRLLGHADGPITPAELLIALHTIDSSKVDLKTVMKATSLCFAEKTIYTQEVLAVVMQQLMDVTPLPTLLMRTVIQSLSLYPRLSGFVMNILQRLIVKQVWKQKVVWEGFVKCCQRTKPQSFQVLLQLPSVQLAEALSLCPDLHQPLLEHVKAFTESQRAHLPSSVMDVLNGQVGQITTSNGDSTTVTVKVENINEILTTEPLPPGMD